MPLPSSHIPGIDVVTRDADGYLSPLEGETVTLRYVGGADIDDFVSGDQGFIEGQLLVGVQSESEVEYYSATKAGTIRFITARAAADAYGEEVTLVLDDDFAEYKASEFAEIYVKDTTDTNIPLIRLGTQLKGTTVKYPFESAIAKDLDVFAQPRTKDFEFGRMNPQDNASDSLSNVGGENALTVSVLGFLTEVIVSSFTIDLNDDTAQEAYVVPGDVELILTKRVYRNPTDDVTDDPESVILLDGAAGASEELFLNASGLDATNKRNVVLIESMPIYAPGEAVSFIMSGAIGTAKTLDVDIFGYFRPATADELDIIDGGDSGDEYTDIIDAGDSGDEFTDIIDGGT
jgi:hypothetical protein